MLHIVKQFIFGLTLSLKSELNNSDQFNAALNNLENSDELLATKATLEINQFFKNLDLDNNWSISWDEKSKSFIEDEQIKVLFDKIGLTLPRGGRDILLGSVKNKLIEFQWERNVDIRESQLSREAFNKEILDTTPDKFSDPVLSDSDISEWFNTINKRGSFNSETIWTYLHDWDQNDIIMKKDGKGKYYIELDNSVSGWGNDIVSETTDIQTIQKVEELVKEITAGNLFKSSPDEKWKDTEDNNPIETQEIITERDDLNYSSLSKIISSMNFSELQELQSYFENNNRKSEWAKMRSIGYNPDGSFGNTEMKEIIKLVDSVIKNQELLRNTKDYREKLKIIFDYNVDGLLDNEQAFYTKEKQIFEKITTEEHFENILKNLWYTDKAQFDSEFNENYYSAREKFKNLLAISLDGDYVLDPGLMMTNPDAKKQLNEQLQLIDDQVKEDFTMSEKVQKMSAEYPELAKQFQENTVSVARQAYLQSISWVVWGAVWVAATFDISNFTEQVIDNASVWVVNGVFWLVLWKEVFRSYDDKTAASVWVVNFIPFVTVTHEFYEEKVSGLKNLFQTEKIENWMKVNIGASWAVWAGVIWLNYEKVDEKTQEGRDQLKEQMTDMLSDVIDNINDKKEFSELWMEDTQENKKYYEQIKALYLATWGNEIAKSEIVTWAANLYERMLAEENEWFTINGVTLAAIYTTVLWFIPTIWVRGEYSSVSWEKRRFVISKLEGQSNFTIEKGNFTTIDEYKELNKELNQYESGFSYKTRYNDSNREWNWKFLDPNNSIDNRYKVITEISKRVWDLQKVNLHEFLLKYASSTQEKKLAIISTLGAWTRKSKDVKNADTPEKLIKLDKERRTPFNNIFGFDTSKYANQYYKLLSKQEKLNSIPDHGTSFDAISALNVWWDSTIENNKLNTRAYGIDMIHGSIDMIADKDDNPIQVEITDTQDKLDFAANVKKLAVHHGDALYKLAADIEDGSISLFFYKDPDGFNDRILPVMNKVEAKETISVDVYTPKYDVIAWSFFGSGHEDKKKSDDNQNGGNVETETWNQNNNNNASDIWSWEGGYPGSNTTENTSKVSNAKINRNKAGAAILAHDISTTNLKK